MEHGEENGSSCSSVVILQLEPFLTQPLTSGTGHIATDAAAAEEEAVWQPWPRRS